MSVSHSIKHKPSPWSRNFTHKINENTNPKEALYKNGHSNFLHCSQNPRIAQMLNNRWIDKWCYIHTVEHCLARKENGLLIKLTPWKDPKTGCMKKAGLKNRAHCTILLHEVLEEAKLVHSKRNRNNGSHSAGGWLGKDMNHLLGDENSLYLGKCVGYTDVWICHWIVCLRSVHFPVTQS